MAAASLLKYLHLAYLSHPSSERLLYRAIRKLRIRTIVELGVGSGQRAARMIEVALRYNGGQPVRYTGIDLFESRPSSTPGVTIKCAYRTLKPLGANVQLVPGDPYSALARCANSLTSTDLLIIAADQDEASLSRAWFYVPRMLSERSLVYLEKIGDGEKRVFHSMTHAEIETLASAVAAPRRRAA